MSRDLLEKNKNVNKVSTAILKLVDRKSPQKETKEQKTKRLKAELITIKDKREMYVRKQKRVQEEQNRERSRFEKIKKPTLGEASAFANRMKILIYEEKQLKDLKENCSTIEKRIKKELDNLNK